jgi:hypothetical protein
MRIIGFIMGILVLSGVSHIENDDDLREAARLEQLADADAALGRPAAQPYLEAQRLLMPPGSVWRDREAYDRRMAAFSRIQEKLYTLDGNGIRRDFAPAPAKEEPVEAAPIATPPAAPPPSGDLQVWDFFPGLVVQVAQTFRDYDGQEILAGEVLHFLDKSYFSYDGGHTLLFAEKTIRLADVVDEHRPIIANEGNAWFRPVT